VIIRDNFENAFARCASTRFFRNLMFEEWEWPAMFPQVGPTGEMPIGPRPLSLGLARPERPLASN